MHELSIAASIVEAVTESAAAYPGAKVKEVRLRIGALASIVEESLEFCWELATEGSPLQGSKLAIKKLPVVIYCDGCDADVEIEGVQSFRCPRCGKHASEIHQGRELEIESIELDIPETEAAHPVEEKA